MCLWKWLVVLFCLVFMIQITCSAQIQANRICLHNGGEYFVTGMDHRAPNNAGGKFFLSYHHVPARGVNSPGGLYYPWKIKGWAWTGMQAYSCGSVWVWSSALQYNHNPVETVKDTVEFVLDWIDHNLPPDPVLFTEVPNVGMPSFYGAGRVMAHPSSFGGFDAYNNLFAIAPRHTWIIPSTQPFYAFEFCYLVAESAIYLESSCSIYEYVWENAGAYMQYLVMSGDETDCTGTLGGNKGINFLIGKKGSGNSFYYFPNECEGGRHEWAMCLLVDDAVSIPVNMPGVSSSANPYAAFGFDVGSATVSIHQSSGSGYFLVMSEDYASPNSIKYVLAGIRQSGPCIPFGGNGYRIPHGFDVMTDIFISLFFYFSHSVHPGYPGCMLGTTTGGHTSPMLLGASPHAVGLEVFISTICPTSRIPSAGYLTTFA